MPPSPTITVALVDDDGAHRSVLETMVEYADGLQLAGSYGSVEAALDALRAEPAPPDVLLLDVNLPGASGIEGLPALRAAAPDLRAVMLTVHDDAEHVFHALEAGASGYVVKGASLDVLLAAIREAHGGGMLLPPPVARRVQAFFQARLAPPEYHLSAREREVLGLMADGLSQKMIADRLCVSTLTVSSHVQHIYEKLHVNNAPAAVSRALRDRLL